MEFRSIADTGIEVGVIGFGAEWMVDKSQDEVNKLVTYCMDNDVNLLDCWMSDPSVRSKLGKAIKDNRDKWYIQGHIGSTWQNKQYVRTREMDKVIPAFEDLLERLGTDYIDLGMIHYVDEVAEYERITNNEFMDYVYKLKEDNIIHHIGLSTHNPEVAMKACDNPDIVLVMFSINPAFDMMPATESIDDYFELDNYGNLYGIQAERQELYEKAMKTNTALTVMKPYAGGRLLKQEESPFGVALTPVQCLEYILTRPSAKSVLVGVNDITELDGALEYLSASDEDRNYSRILTTAPKSSYLGQCTYCGHCAPCSANIDIKTVNKFYDLAVTHDSIPDSIRDHYNQLEYKADSCTKCGMCMDRCPFKVDIIDMMDKTRKLFE
ncbi:aldo/keto reductase [Methanosphaera sp. BMS]|uniref:aldo/keto reductase n=1 Tax=Methanosphaera sp. BMS TaxID=1789762 RepID=UPI000DC1C044|nr:aldo/keto reductase [Methanosphaera sp. BMS]AWX32219.1 aldo/keto reductase [Methanosphaera sp. BMS]